jgi:uncharacterized protein with PQ loop repeat
LSGMRDVAHLARQYKEQPMLELWMSCVGISCCLGTVPQIVRLVKRKTSEDISVSLWLVNLHGTIWWIVYGVVTESVCLLVTCVLALILDGTAFALILRYRYSREGTVNDQPTYAQPDYAHLWDAYVTGAKSGQKHLDASDTLIRKSADAYCKKVHLEIDPVMFRQLGQEGELVS